MANRLKLQPSHRHQDTSWNPKKVLADALAEKADFLQKHPEHIEFQKEIDRLLDKAGSSENRMNVLAIMMEGKLVELHHQLQQLNKILLKSGAVPSVDRLPPAMPNLIRFSKN